jgi:hypothetical protein
VRSRPIVRRAERLTTTRSQRTMDLSARGGCCSERSQASCVLGVGLRPRDPPREAPDDPIVVSELVFPGEIAGHVDLLARPTRVTE